MNRNVLWTTNCLVYTLLTAHFFHLVHRLHTTNCNGHTSFNIILLGNAVSAHPGHGLDPLNYGWKEKNGYCTSDWFLGLAMPDYLFQEGEREENSIEDLESDQPDVATVFDDDDVSNSENAWSDDSLLLFVNVSVLRFSLLRL